MTLPPHDEPLVATAKERARFTKGLLNTIPIMLAGSIAMSLTSPLSIPSDRPQLKERESPSDLGQTIRASLALAHATSTETAISGAPIQAAALIPSTYTVAAGDTVSAIAGRFGLATASVLALNGLGWRSIIHQGQVLRLANNPKPNVATPGRPAAEKARDSAGRYRIVAGDTIGKIASRFGATEQSILTANGFSRSSMIYAGSTLAIPGKASAAALDETVLTASPAVAVRAIPSKTPNSHVIKKGETIAAIASDYRVTVQDILSANGLGWSSIIYAGRELVIPVAEALVVDSVGIVVLTREMKSNVEEILAVADALGVNRRGKIIALATAMQESTLRNLNYGDRDSLGLFQQRPSAGWGTPTQVTTPSHASRLFFGGHRNPNIGITRGLLDIPNWQRLTLTEAAQAVQRSAFPDAYAKWEKSATAWVKALD